MIYLFTDFSYNGPYVGQLKSVIYQKNSNIRIIDLMHDAPAHHVKYSAFILNALSQHLVKDSICCCVVDPGVGSERAAIAIKFNSNYFIGPDNGLFEYLIRSATNLNVYSIEYDTHSVSKTFHGRDVFAPAAAQISLDNLTSLQSIPDSGIQRFNWKDNLFEIIYIDPFGNLMTGINAKYISQQTIFLYKGQSIAFAETYSKIANMAMCWYVNSVDLVEFATFTNSASLTFNANIGDSVEVLR